jgi:hypothetical protein
MNSATGRRLQPADGLIVYLRQRRRDVGAHEIVALEQQRLARRARQGVSEAIAEI